MLDIIISTSDVHRLLLVAFVSGLGLAAITVGISWGTRAILQVTIKGPTEALE